MKIGIIGGGIIGLTTGVVLAEAEHDVIIYTRDPIDKTTSWAAGATCYPYGTEESARVNGWVTRAIEVLTPLLDNPDAGVLKGDWYKFSEAQDIEVADWLSVVGGRKAEPSECPEPYKSGVYAPLLIMAVDRYVAYLMARLKEAGGVYSIRDVSNADELSDYDAVINCTGIYARDFCSDEKVYPARGQVVVVKNRGVSQLIALQDKKFYLYPRDDQVLLGGSFEEHEWDRTPDDDLTREILEWAGMFEPRLKDPEIIDVRVGLRPMRETVRLEQEALKDGTPLIHNYGHGGAGYTLSWGCAFEVLKMVESL